MASATCAIETISTPGGWSGWVPGLDAEEFNVPSIGAPMPLTTVASPVAEENRKRGWYVHSRAGDGT